MKNNYNFKQRHKELFEKDTEYYLNNCLAFLTWYYSKEVRTVNSVLIEFGLLGKGKNADLPQFTQIQI